MAFKLEDSVKTTLSASVAVGASSIDVHKSSNPWNDVPDPSGDRAILTLTNSTVSPSKIEIITYTSRTDNGDGTYTLGGVTKNALGGHGDQTWDSSDVVIQSSYTDLIVPNEAHGVPRRNANDDGWRVDYVVHTLTGGGSDALDSIDGNNLSEDDTAIVVESFGSTNDRVLHYVAHDFGASQTEKAPHKIVPDTNPGNLAWVLTRGEDNSVDTLSDFQAIPADTVTDGDIIYLKGRNGIGDGGEGAFRIHTTDKSTEVSNDEVTSGDGGIWISIDSTASGANGAGERLFVGMILPEWYGDLEHALEIHDFEAIRLSKSTYEPAGKIAAQLSNIFGQGWLEDDSGSLKGSLIDGSTNSLNNVLDYSFGSMERGLELKDFAIKHTGTGSAITVDNVISYVIEDVKIQCNNSGAFGIKTANSAYFARYSRVVIQEYTDTGMLIDGIGFDHQILEPKVTSSATGAKTGIECRRQNFKISGGQVNTKGGVGILLNAQDIPPEGGLIIGTGFEIGDAIKITGDTSEWRGCVIDTPFFALSTSTNTRVTKGVIFDKARNCVLRDPAVPTPSSVVAPLAEWTANSDGCGIIVNPQVAKAPLTVDASATNAWMYVRGKIGLAERGNITTDPNLTVICEEVETLGRSVHNGTNWDVDEITSLVGDDTATSFTPPDRTGRIEVMTTNAIGEYVSAGFNTANGGSDGLAVGSKGNVVVTDGSLGGTTSTDGKLNVTANSSDGKIYIENRLGSSRKIRWKFHSAFG